jgi:vacuolar protein sorting-associated protein VTA1
VLVVGWTENGFAAVGKMNKNNETMSSSISSSLPPSLKKINVFLKRAEELDRDKSNPESRVAAYNCRQYAVLQGIPLAKKNATTDDNGNNSANKALGQLLDTLETEKHAMSVFSKNEHWKICRKVADRVFDKADSEDRAGVANKGTARSFYAAGTFYEILQQFHNEEIVNKMNNDIDPVVDNDVDEDEASVMEHIEEENQRRIYCKWKATDILNAIKEGRSPTPGGYQQQKQENDEIDENDDDYGRNSNVVEDGVKDEGIEGNVVPLPPPSVPSSDLFELPDHKSNTPQEPPPPPPYDGIEPSLSGQPTTTETSSTVEKNAHEEMFIPQPPSSLPPPHSFSQPPPPPPQNDDPSRNNNVSSSNNNNDGGSSGKGMFSSIFHNNNNNNNNSSNNNNSKKKLSKEEMGDVIELTKFALAALQNGDGELGRERLEQALAVWR